MPLGVGEPADHELSANALGTHQALPPEALSPLERGPDVRNTHVEQQQPLVTLATADTTVDPVAGGASVQEPVVARLGDGFGDRVADLELPPEQLAVVAPELRRIPPDDLEMHNWSSHWPSFPADRPASFVRTAERDETHRSGLRAEAGFDEALTGGSDHRSASRHHGCHLRYRQADRARARAARRQRHDRVPQPGEGKGNRGRDREHG